jgi:hypothetical protein
MIGSILLLSPTGHTLGMLILIAISYFLLVGKSKLIKYLHLALSVLIFIIGLVTTCSIRYILAQKANSPRFDYSLVEGGISSFDLFFQISTIIMISMFVLLICLLLVSKRKFNKIIIETFNILFIITNVVIFLVGLVFSFLTINKFISIPSYVLVLVISELSIFNILLSVKRVISR